ncbi:PucR family transcriptional regulator [Actinoplanes sp. URMC 104]|uniref:PucR family transcriptional regulator n=1 Tax=Actinoplanes sp. URMC 104 TaxID=3423409 RepID=UPI003F1DB50E
MPTLDEVFRIPSLRLTVLVEAPAGTPVRWVATSELDDPAPFLEGGEIVLTTGLATATWDREEWRDYVGRLRDAGAVGLGLGVGLTFTEAPLALVAAARSSGLALFTVPRPVPFVAVSRAVARLVQRAEERALQQLTRAAAATEGASAILARLARLVRGDVVVCDNEARVILPPPTSVADRPPPDLPGDLDRLIERLRPRGLRASHTEAGPSGSLSIQPLGLSGDPTAYLVISTPSPWDGAARNAVAIAASLLSLDLERRADALTTAREIRAAALDLFLVGRAESAQAFLALRAAQAAPLRGPSFQVVRLTAADPALTLATLERWAATHPSSRLVGLSATDRQPVALLDARTDAADTLAILGTGVRAGVGDTGPLNDLAMADATAREALTHASAHRPLARWADVVDAGLPALLPDAAATGFARTVLGPLAADSAENAILLATLDAFHHHHGQITVIAAALGVHRNTVSRRLRRIADLTGRDPDTPRGRVELWTAVEILRRAG